MSETVVVQPLSLKTMFMRRISGYCLVCAAVVLILLFVEKADWPAAFLLIMGICGGLSLGLMEECRVRGLVSADEKGVELTPIFGPHRKISWHEIEAISLFRYPSLKRIWCMELRVAQKGRIIVESTGPGFLDFLDLAKDKTPEEIKKRLAQAESGLRNSHPESIPLFV